MRSQSNRYNSLLAEAFIFKTDLNKCLKRSNDVNVMLALRDVLKNPSITEEQLKVITKKRGIKTKSEQFETVVALWEMFSELKHHIKKLDKTPEIEDKINHINDFLAHLKKCAKHNRFNVFRLEALYYKSSKIDLNELIKAEKKKESVCDGIIDVCLKQENINYETAMKMINLWYHQLVKLSPNFTQLKKDLYKCLANYEVTEAKFDLLWEKLQHVWIRKITKLYPAKDIYQGIVDDIVILNKLPPEERKHHLDKIMKLDKAIKGLDDDHLKELFARNATNIKSFINTCLIKNISGFDKLQPNLNLLVTTPLFTRLNQFSSRKSPHHAINAIEIALKIQASSLEDQMKLDELINRFSTLKINDGIEVEYRFLLDDINSLRKSIGLGKINLDGSEDQKDSNDIFDISKWFPK